MSKEEGFSAVNGGEIPEPKPEAASKLVSSDRVMLAGQREPEAASKLVSSDRVTLNTELRPGPEEVKEALKNAGADIAAALSGMAGVAFKVDGKAVGEEVKPETNVGTGQEAGVENVR